MLFPLPWDEGGEEATRAHEAATAMKSPLQAAREATDLMKIVARE